MRLLQQALFSVGKVVSYLYLIFNSVSLLVRPFFPSTNGQGACGVEQGPKLDSSKQTLLTGSDQTVIDGSTLTLKTDDVPSLGWPFIICSAIHILPAIGFLMMGKKTPEVSKM